MRLKPNGVGLFAEMLYIFYLFEKLLTIYTISVSWVGRIEKLNGLQFARSWYLPTVFELNCTESISGVISTFLCCQCGRNLNSSEVEPPQSETLHHKFLCTIRFLQSEVCLFFPPHPWTCLKWKER